MRVHCGVCARGLALVALVLGLAGCGRESPKYFDYGSGKINLDRIGYITPRIRVGIDEYTLNDEQIANVMKKIEGGQYSFFQVEARIMFDEFAWPAYKSRQFDKAKSPPTPADLKAIRQGLEKALATYRSI